MYYISFGNIVIRKSDMCTNHCIKQQQRRRRQRQQQNERVLTITQLIVLHSISIRRDYFYYYYYDYNIFLCIYDYNFLVNRNYIIFLRVLLWIHFRPKINWRNTPPQRQFSLWTTNIKENGILLSLLQFMICTTYDRTYVKWNGW